MEAHILPRCRRVRHVVGPLVRGRPSVEMVSLGVAFGGCCGGHRAYKLPRWAAPLNGWPRGRDACRRASPGVAWRRQLRLPSKCEASLVGCTHRSVGP